MALLLLENRDFLGFRMIFKVWLNQIFSKFSTMLYTIKYRLSLIMVYFTSTVHKLWLGLGFLSITRICKCLMAMKWISCKIYHNMLHSFHCLIQNLECGVSVITRSTFSSFFIVFFCLCITMNEYFMKLFNSNILMWMFYSYTVDFF